MAWTKEQEESGDHPQVNCGLRLTWRSPQGGQVAIAVGTRKGLWDPSQRVHLAGAESHHGFRCVLRLSSLLCFHSPFEP